MRKKIRVRKRLGGSTVVQSHLRRINRHSLKSPIPIDNNSSIKIDRIRDDLKSELKTIKPLFRKIKNLEEEDHELYNKIEKLED